MTPCFLYNGICNLIYTNSIINIGCKITFIKNVNCYIFILKLFLNKKYFSIFIGLNIKLTIIAIVHTATGHTAIHHLQITLFYL